MKRVIILIALVCLTVPAFGFDVDFAGTYMTRYMFRGERLIDNAYIAPAVAIKSNNFELSATSIYDNKKKETFRNVYQLTFKTQVNKAAVDVGLVRYDPHNVNGKDTNEFFVKATWKGAWRPSFAVFFDFDEGSGKYFQAGFARNLGTSKNEVLLGANVGYVAQNGYMGLDKNGSEFTGLYDGELYLKSSFKWGKRITVEPMLAYSFPLSNDAKNAIQGISVDKASKNLYGGVTFHITF